MGKIRRKEGKKGRRRGKRRRVITMKEKGQMGCGIAIFEDECQKMYLKYL